MVLLVLTAKLHHSSARNREHDSYFKLGCSLQWHSAPSPNPLPPTQLLTFRLWGLQVFKRTKIYIGHPKENTCSLHKGRNYAHRAGSYNVSCSYTLILQSWLLRTYPVAHVENVYFINSLWSLSSSKEDHPGAVHLGEAEGSAGRRANTSSHWGQPLTYIHADNTRCHGFFQGRSQDFHWGGGGGGGGAQLDGEVVIVCGEAMHGQLLAFFLSQQLSISIDF